MPVRELRSDEEVLPLPGRGGSGQMRRVRPLREDEEVVQPPAAPEGDSMQAMVDRAETARQDVNEQTSGVVSTANRVAQSFNQGLLEPIGLAGPASRIGITPPDGERREGFVPSMARTAGEGAGIAALAVAPALRSPKLLQSGQQVISRLSGATPGVRESLGLATERGAQMVARNPAGFFAGELGLGAAAGAGGEAAERAAPDTPFARAFGELAGGVTAAGGVGAARGAARGILRVSPIAAATRATFNVLRGRSPMAGGKVASNRATERVYRATDDPQGTLNEADQADILPEARERMTIGERAEEPGMLSLERAITESTPRLSQANQERFAEINEMLRRSTTEAVEAGDATPEQMREYLDGLLATRLNIALERANERITALGPDVSAEQANRLARVEIDRALKAAEQQEDELWALVPDDIAVPAESTVARMQQRLAEAESNRVAQARRAYLPRVAFEFVGRYNDEGEWMPGKLGESPTTGELKTLRSELLDAARRERAKAAPNRQRLAAIADLQGALLEDMQAASPGPDSALDRARAFSADKAQRFYQGDVGRILGYDVQGGEQVPPGLTLESTVGRGSAAARESVDALNRAVERSGDQPAMQGYIESYLTDQFLRQSQRNGDFNPNAAQSFLSSHQDVLARFPELRRRFETSIQSGRAVEELRRANDPKVSAAAVVLNAPPGQAVQRIVSSRDPGAAMRETVEQLRTDQSGQALAGMRRAFADYLLGRSEVAGRPDARDQPTLMGSRLQQTLGDARVKAAMDEILSDEQRRRLEQIRNTALRMDRSRQAQPAEEGVIGDRQGVVADLLNRVFFAQVGRVLAGATGGGTVQTPGIMVRFGQRLQEMGVDPARRLLVDAVTAQDDSLMRAIMMQTGNSPRRAQRVNQRLQGWMVQAARDYGIDLEELRQEEAGEASSQKDSPPAAQGRILRTPAPQGGGRR